MSLAPLRRLRRHPFAVEAFFTHSVVLTYAFPPAVLRPLLPACLELDTHLDRDDDRHAFVAAAAVETRALRPRGLPAFLGRDFLLLGYRIFARYRARDGRRLRGLFILRSETDRPTMAFFGNLLTRYRYVRRPLALHANDGRTTVTDPDAGLSITVESGDRRRAGDGDRGGRADDADDGDGGGDTASVDLPPGSPFTTLRDARRFAGPLPFTFGVEPGANRVVIVEGVRSGWEPRLARVVEHRVPFVEALADEPPVLASAFTVENIPYRWKKGVVERWRE